MSCSSSLLPVVMSAACRRLPTTRSAAIANVSNFTSRKFITSSSVLLRNYHSDNKYGFKNKGVSRLSGTASIHTPISGLELDKRSHASAILDNIKQLPNIPAAAATIGVVGLAPFLATPYQMFYTGAFAPELALYQTFYGAAVLAFVGGIRWGLTLPSGSSQRPDLSNLGYSMVPVVFGYGSLVAGSYMDCFVVGNVGVMLGLGLTGYMDLMMLGYPGWFKGLRFILTIGAVLGMLGSLAGKLMLDEERKDDEKKLEAPTA